MDNRRVTTGFSGLDEILDGLRIGDNVVWKVDSIDHYRYFVSPYVEKALAEKREVIYLRFGQHPPVVDQTLPVEVCELDPREGFETFACAIHALVTEKGVVMAPNQEGWVVSAWH